MVRWTRNLQKKTWSERKFYWLVFLYWESFFVKFYGFLSAYELLYSENEVMILSKVQPSYTLWLTLFNHLCACILILNASIYFDTSFKPPALSLSILEERENIKLGAVKLTFCARGVIPCVKALSCYKRTYCRTH